MNMEKKWYIFKRSAEGAAIFIVSLTDSEVGIVKHFLERQYDGPDEGYSGRMEYVAGPFATREDAVDYSMKEYRHIYIYDYRNEDEEDWES